jgi:transcription initiation factor IIE alpha subunit
LDARFIGISFTARAETDAENQYENMFLRSMVEQLEGKKTALIEKVAKMIESDKAIGFSVGACCRILEQPSFAIRVCFM